MNTQSSGTPEQQTQISDPTVSGPTAQAPSVPPQVQSQPSMHKVVPPQSTAQKTAWRPAQTTYDPDKPTWRTKLKSLYIEYVRVLRSTRKPEYDEVKTIVKVTGIGIIIIGAIGFFISMIRLLITGQ